MKSLAQQLNEYRQQHANRTNQITHYVGIPAILISLMLVLSWVSVSFGGHWHLTFAWIAVIALLVYYYFLDVKLAVVMTVILALVNWACTAIAYPTPSKGSLILFLILFIGGWILQFVGHSFEKNKHSFFTGVYQVLVAPLYVLVEAVLALKLGSYFDLEENQKTSKPDDKNP